VQIRDADPGEAAALVALQRRSSDIWDRYCDQLAEYPDAIELPQAFIDNGWVRVAVATDDTPLGFAVLIPGDGTAHELDGLFVEPARMRCGIGRALLQDACRRARANGACCSR
jgi:GNAT superfamily N-acetyltransferase